MIEKFDLSKADYKKRAAINHYVAEMNDYYGTNFSEHNLALTVNEYWNDFVEHIGSDRDAAYQEYFVKPMLELQKSLIQDIYYAKLSEVKMHTSCTVYPSVYVQKINHLLAFAIESYTNYSRDALYNYNDALVNFHARLIDYSPKSSFEYALEQMKVWDFSVPGDSSGLRTVTPIYSQYYREHESDWLSHYSTNSQLYFEGTGNLTLYRYENGNLDDEFDHSKTSDESIHEILDAKLNIKSDNEIRKEQEERNRKWREAEEARRIAEYNKPENVLARANEARNEKNIKKAAYRNPFPRLPLIKTYANTADHYAYVAIAKFNEKYGTAIQLEGLMHDVRNINWSNANTRRAEFDAAIQTIYGKIFKAGAFAVIDAAVTSRENVDGLDFTQLAIDTTNLLEQICLSRAKAYSNPGQQRLIERVAYGMNSATQSTFVAKVSSIIHDAKNEYLEKFAGHKFVCKADEPALQRLDEKEKIVNAEAAVLADEISRLDETYTNAADALYESYKTPQRVPTDRIISDSQARLDAAKAENATREAKQAALEAAYVLEKRIERRYGWWLPRVFRAVSYNKCRNQLDSMKRELNVTDVKEAMKSAQMEILEERGQALSNIQTSIVRQREKIFADRAEILFTDKTDYKIIIDDKVLSNNGHARGENGLCDANSHRNSLEKATDNYINNNMPRKSGNELGENWGDFGPLDPKKYGGHLMKSPYGDDVLTKPKDFRTVDAIKKTHMSDEENVLFGELEIESIEGEVYTIYEEPQILNEEQAPVVENQIEEPKNDLEKIDENVEEENVEEENKEEENKEEQKEEDKKEVKEEVKEEVEEEPKDSRTEEEIAKQKAEEEKRRQRYEHELKLREESQRELEISKLYWKREKEEKERKKKAVEEREKRIEGFKVANEKAISEENQEFSSFEKSKKDELSKLTGDLDFSRSEVDRLTTELEQKEEELGILKIKVAQTAQLMSQDISDMAGKQGAQSESEIKAAVDKEFKFVMSQCNEKAAEINESNSMRDTMKKIISENESKIENINNELEQRTNEHNAEMKFRNAMQTVEFDSKGYPILPEGVEIPERLKASFENVFSKGEPEEVEREEDTEFYMFTHRLGVYADIGADNREPLDLSKDINEPENQEKSKPVSNEKSQVLENSNKK